MLSVVSAGSVQARWAMARYFEELAARLPGGFDPGAGLDEAPTQYDPPNGAFVLARAGGETVGCGAVAFLDDQTAEVKRMWVAAGIRGRGVGTRLLARLEDEARLGGRSRVVLDTNATLTEAVAMYESSGYVATARYNDNPYAERWFTKNL
ncbi:MAG: GNAT family N-acetyltransferase [Egibacteraceae bacterium]